MDEKSEGNQYPRPSGYVAARAPDTNTGSESPGKRKACSK